MNKYYDLYIFILLLLLLYLYNYDSLNFIFTTVNIDGSDAEVERD